MVYSKNDDKMQQTAEESLEREGPAVTRKREKFTFNFSGWIGKI